MARHLDISFEHADVLHAGSSYGGPPEEHRCATAGWLTEHGMLQETGVTALSVSS